MSATAGRGGRSGGPSARRGWLWVLGLVVVVGGLSAVLARGAGSVAPVGRTAPAFTLPDLHGRMVSLRSLGPGDIALRFGSVNCTICDPDWGVLARWQAQAGAPRIVAIEVGQSPAVVGVRLHASSYPVPVLIDASGAVALQYGVGSLPAFAFIDRAGRLVAVRSVVTRTGIWPTATWRHFVQLLHEADRSAPVG